MGVGVGGSLSPQSPSAEALHSTARSICKTWRLIFSIFDWNDVCCSTKQLHSHRLVIRESSPTVINNIPQMSETYLHNKKPFA